MELGNSLNDVIGTEADVVGKPDSSLMGPLFKTLGAFATLSIIEKLGSELMSPSTPVAEAIGPNGEAVAKKDSNLLRDVLVPLVAAGTVLKIIETLPNQAAQQFKADRPKAPKL